MLYYFLTTAFPEVHTKSLPEMSFQELSDLLLESLSEKDQEAYRDFLLYIDLKNIKAFLLGKPLDPRGFLSQKELREALLRREGLPDYLFEFFDRFEGKKEQVLRYASVYAQFFSENRTGFLGKYFGFVRSMRLVLTALRAQRWHRNLDEELQFEPIDSSLPAYILAQKGAKDFEPPEEFADLKTLFVAHEEAPMDFEKKLLEYQIKKIEELEEGRLFQIDQVLAFAAKLLLVESWHNLDQEKGKAALDQLI
ncbi:MAG: DUF2764 family protein [Chlamydiota bacterium]